jgi:hypothetical protein
MCYDPSAGYLLLYHGIQNGTYSFETWIFQRGDWTKLPSAGVGSADPSGLAYDPSYHGVVLVGAVSQTNGTIGTWLFQNGSWVKLRTGPMALGSSVGVSSQALVYDGIGGYLLLIADGPQAEHTWMFSHGNWTLSRHVSVPSARYSFGMAYDLKDREVLQFGGDKYFSASNQIVYGQTWTYS